MVGIVVGRNLRELAERHADRSVKARKAEKSDFLDEATRIYERLHEKVDFSDPFGSLDKGLNGTEACLFGTLSKLIGMDDEADKIYAGLRSYVSKKNGLYSPWGVDFPNTEENAAIGIFINAMGKGKRAKDLYSKLKSLSDDGLYIHNGMNKGKYVEDNALVGILASSLGKKANAKKLFKKISSDIWKTDELYGSVSDGGETIYDASSYANAAMAIYCSMIGREEEGDKAYESLLPKTPADSTLSSEFQMNDAFGMKENSLIGIYLCMKAGKQISPSKKRPKG